MNLYRLSGELIRCALPLDDYASRVAASNGTEPTITVALSPSVAQAELDHREVVNAHDIDGRPFLTIARHPDGYRIRAHGYVDYLVGDKGRSVRCVPVPGCPDNIMAQLFVDRVLPNAISAGNTPVFHSSAIAYRGSAGLFVGDPGLGKSTLASALSPPADWLCDDSAVLCLKDAEVIVQPSYPFARLFHDSLGAMGETHGEQASARNSKRRLQHDRDSAPAPLRAVFALGADADLKIDQLTPRDGVTELARHLYRLDPSDRRALIDEFATLERVADAVPIYRLDYPRCYDALDRVSAAIFTELSSN